MMKLIMRLRTLFKSLLLWFSAIALPIYANASRLCLRQLERWYILYALITMLVFLQT